MCVEKRSISQGTRCSPVPVGVVVLEPHLGGTYKYDHRRQCVAYCNMIIIPKFRLVIGYICISIFRLVSAGFWIGGVTFPVDEKYTAVPSL